MPGKDNLFDLVILDLTMPISDGYETCKNIINLYAVNNKIFKISNKNQNSEDSSQIESSDHLQGQDLMPVIVACTSSIIDENLKKKLKDHGFKGAHEAPIQDSAIKNEILP